MLEFRGYRWQGISEFYSHFDGFANQKLNWGLCDRTTNLVLVTKGIKIIIFMTLVNNNLYFYTNFEVNNLCENTILIIVELTFPPPEYRQIDTFDRSRVSK